MVACAMPIKAPPEVKDLVKSDTTFFVEAVRSELDQSLSLLLVKLYRRNPIQLPSSSSVETRLVQLKAPRLNLQEFGDPTPTTWYGWRSARILRETGHTRLSRASSRW